MKLAFVIICIAVLNVFCVGSCTKFKYNVLVDDREIVRERNGDLQAQYQRRYNLTLEIVRVIKAETDVKRTVLLDVTNVQALMTRLKTAESGTNLNKTEALQRRLGLILDRLLTDIGSDSKLSSNQTFQDFRASIEGSENRINFSRLEYNTAVKAYNVKLMQFPNNLYAKSLGFERMTYFQADSSANSFPGPTVNR